MKPYKEINPSATSLSQIDFKSGQLFRGEGFIKYDDLPRVCAEIKARAPNYLSDSNSVKWSLLSSIDELVGGGQDYRIQLDLEFKYPLECQRCLEIYEEKEKLLRVTANYNKILENYTGKVLKVDGKESIEKVHLHVVEYLEKNDLV